ncbi:MAG TPA: hypothetical protein VMV99_09345 [Rhodanobacter sp.]|nr:hypothetical protein [Rhodanobacter sp.]
MTDTSKTYWFPAKRHGWGWGVPRVWQGWVVLVAYVAVLVATGLIFSPAENALAFNAGLAIATIALLLVCWLKGEPPRWRSGSQ